MVERAPAPPAPAPLPGASEAEVAKAAWAYIERNWHESTGLVSATDQYPYLTTWDMGSVLAALYSARGLGLVDEAEYERRMARTLETLAEIALFDGAAFNKSYAARTGQMVDRRDRPSARGYGWSVVDLGRLLMWLKVVERRTPQHAAAARRVVQRLDFDRLVSDGHLVGSNLEGRGIATYTEGRVGYDQYSAAGFALWGRPAAASADVHRNTEPVEVMGQVLYADKRGGNRVTSEPFVLLGLEAGWTPEMRQLAESVLAAQRERYERTGIVTVASEDAMTEPPHYFYYYCIYLDGRAFAVDAQGAKEPLEGPRWVSAKAAYAWHALVPDVYTATAVEAVGPALGDGGWYSGVYEGGSKRAGSQNVNTAAVILESLLYRETGRPLIER